MYSNDHRTVRNGIFKDPAGLITYEYTVTGEATTTTDEDGNLVTVPGTTTRQTVQRQVMFTSEG